MPLVMIQALDGAEAAGVVEDEGFPVVESKAHRRVGARRAVRRTPGSGEETSGHAEVDRDHALPVELKQDVLAATSDLDDAAAAHPAGEPVSSLSKHVGVQHLSSADGATDHGGPEPTHDRLRLG